MPLQMGLDYGQYGIRVLAVNPGTVRMLLCMNACQCIGFFVCLFVCLHKEDTERERERKKRKNERELKDRNCS